MCIMTINNFLQAFSQSYYIHIFNQRLYSIVFNMPLGESMLLLFCGPMSMTNYGPDNQYNWTQQLRACTAVQICVSSKGNTQLARGLAETIGTIFLDKPFNH